MFGHIFYELTSLRPALFPLFLFDAALFENREWVWARSHGFKGRNETIGFFVDLTGFLATVFYYLFIFSVGYDHGVGTALFIFFSLLGVGLLSTPLSTFLFKGNNPIVWMISTLSLYPLVFFIAPYTSWFGFIPMNH
jgi:hypothetical protein